MRAVSTSHGTGSRLSASSRSGGDASTTDNIPMQPIGSKFSIKHLGEGRRDTFGGLKQGMLFKYDVIPRRTYYANV